jgi:hypothetical protein
MIATKANCSFGPTGLIRTNRPQSTALSCCVVDERVIAESLTDPRWFFSWPAKEGLQSVHCPDHRYSVTTEGSPGALCPDRA